MEHKNDDNKLNKLIRKSMELDNAPSVELNNSLKASLYQYEAGMKKETKTHTISLWFVPMILNVIIFSLFAIFALLVIENPYISKLVVGICCYISVAGIIVTTVGVKRTNMKQIIAIHIQKRGVLV